MVVILATSENVARKSGPLVSVKRLETNLTLYLSIEPSTLYLTLYTHLYPSYSLFIGG